MSPIYQYEHSINLFEHNSRKRPTIFRLFIKIFDWYIKSETAQKPFRRRPLPYSERKEGSSPQKGFCSYSGVFLAHHIKTLRAHKNEKPRWNTLMMITDQKINLVLFKSAAQICFFLHLIIITVLVVLEWAQQEASPIHHYI